MQQAIGGPDPVQKRAQRSHDAKFIKHSHVLDRDVMLQQRGMFRRIDRPDAIKTDAVRRKRGRKGWKRGKA